MGGSPKEPGDSIRSRDTGRSAGNSNTVSYCKEWARLVFAGTAAKCKLPCAGGRMIIRCSKPAGPRKGAASLGSEYFRLRPRLPVPVSFRRHAAGPRVAACGRSSGSEPCHGETAFAHKTYDIPECCAVLADVPVLYSSISKDFRRARRKKANWSKNWSISYFPFSYIAPFARGAMLSDR